jgi:hypothetical protein
VVLAEVVPVFEAGEAGQGIEGMDGREVGVGDLAEESFEGRDTEGHTGGVEDRGIQLFEVIAAPFFPVASLPFGFDEPEAFVNM